MDEARSAFDLDPTDANAHAVLTLGGIGDRAGGFDHVERALSMNPNCVPAYHAKGWLLLFSGWPAEGREMILSAMRLDPRSAANVAFRGHIAISHYFEHDYESAVAVASRLLADRPDHPWGYRWLAAALGQLDRTDEAGVALGKAIDIAPGVFEAYVRQGTLVSAGRLRPHARRPAKGGLAGVIVLTDRLRNFRPIVLRDVHLAC